LPRTDAAKIDQDAVGYNYEDDGFACETCDNWEGYNGEEDEDEHKLGTCKLVAGKLWGLASCDRWVRDGKTKPKRDTEGDRQDAQRPNQRGLVKKLITNKTGERQTVWIRPEEAHRNRGLKVRLPHLFVSQQEFSQFEKDNSRRHRPGNNESFFVVRNIPKTGAEAARIQAQIEAAEADFKRYTREAYAGRMPWKVPEAEREAISAENLRRSIVISELAESLIQRREPFFYKRAGTNSISHKKDAQNEVLCSEIAAKAGIPHNDVRMAPAGINNNFKPKGQVGTIHSILPGTNWKNIEKDNPTLFAKYEAPTTFERSLKHPDLAKIYAFDLFTGNTDRNNSNLMYDQATDRFHSLDMGFGYDAPSKAGFLMKNLDFQSRQPYTLTSAEKENAKILADTLRTLRQQNPPKAIAAQSEVIDRASRAKLPSQGNTPYLSLDMLQGNDQDCAMLADRLDRFVRESR
jgi:hypothetical protein